MEGRTIARPNRAAGRALNDIELASMEGRTIARPNRTLARVDSHRRGRFNGGPDNCPAKRWRRVWLRRRCRCFNGGPDNCPAKPFADLTGALVLLKLQWRAGQLPGQTRRGGGACSTTRTSFNGGPDNCPAKLDPSRRARNQMMLLQWRAGQLPGQTRPHI